MANKLSQGDCVPIGYRNYPVTPFLHSLRFKCQHVSSPQAGRCAVEQDEVANINRCFVLP
jgi:hypothetical protein